MNSFACIARICFPAKIDKLTHTSYPEMLAYQAKKLPSLIQARRVTTVALAALVLVGLGAVYSVGSTAVLGTLSATIPFAVLFIALAAGRWLLSRAIHNQSPEKCAPGLEYIYAALSNTDWVYNPSKKELLILKDDFNSNPRHRSTLIMKAERHGIFVKFHNQIIEAAINPEFEQKMQQNELSSNLKTAAFDLFVGAKIQELPLSRINALQRYLCVTLERKGSVYVQPPFIHQLDKDTILLRTSEIPPQIRNQFANILQVDDKGRRHTVQGNVELNDPVVERFCERYDRGTWNLVQWQ